MFGLLGTTMNVTWGTLVYIATNVVKLIIIYIACAMIMKRMGLSGRKKLVILMVALSFVVIATASFYSSKLMMKQFEALATENVFGILAMMDNRMTKILSLLMEVMVYLPGVTYLSGSWKK